MKWLSAVIKAFSGIARKCLPFLEKAAKGKRFKGALLLAPHIVGFIREQFDSDATKEEKKAIVVGKAKELIRSNEGGIAKSMQKIFRFDVDGDGIEEQLPLGVFNMAIDFALSFIEDED